MVSELTQVTCQLFPKLPLPWFVVHIQSFLVCENFFSTKQFFTYDSMTQYQLWANVKSISALKASIIGRKKEAAAEKLQEAMDEVKWSSFRTSNRLYFYITLRLREWDLHSNTSAYNRVVFTCLSVKNNKYLLWDLFQKLVPLFHPSKCNLLIQITTYSHALSHASCWLHELQVLIGSLSCVWPFWLPRVNTLVFILRHSIIENHSY